MNSAHLSRTTRPNCSGVDFLAVPPQSLSCCSYSQGKNENMATKAETDEVIRYARGLEKGRVIYLHRAADATKLPEAVVMSVFRLLEKKRVGVLFIGRRGDETRLLLPSDGVVLPKETKPPPIKKNVTEYAITLAPDEGGGEVRYQIPSDIKAKGAWRIVDIFVALYDSLTAQEKQGVARVGAPVLVLVPGAKDSTPREGSPVEKTDSSRPAK